jgi:prevent-host-death family protein
MTARTVSVAEFKAHCDDFLASVVGDQTDLIITEQGKPIAKLVGCGKSSTAPIFGFMAGTAAIMGDVLSPLDVEWNAELE